MRNGRSELLVASVRAAVTTLGFALGAPATRCLRPDSFIDSGPPSITNSRSATVTFILDDPAATPASAEHRRRSLRARPAPGSERSGGGAAHFRCSRGGRFGHDPCGDDPSRKTDFTPRETTVTPTARPIRRPSCSIWLASRRDVPVPRNGRAFAVARRRSASAAGERPAHLPGRRSTSRGTLIRRRLPIPGGWRFRRPSGWWQRLRRDPRRVPRHPGIRLGAIDYGTRDQCFGQTARHSGTLPDRDTLFAIGS